MECEDASFNDWDTLLESLNDEDLLSVVCQYYDDLEGNWSSRSDQLHPKLAPASLSVLAIGHAVSRLASLGAESSELDDIPSACSAFYACPVLVEPDTEVVVPILIAACILIAKGRRELGERCGYGSWDVPIALFDYAMANFEAIKVAWPLNANRAGKEAVRSFFATSQFADDVQGYRGRDLLHVLGDGTG